MKVRFYCDVPVWNHGESEQYLSACMFPPTHGPFAGYKRIAFDVDFPPDVLRREDVVALAEVVSEAAKAL